VTIIKPAQRHKTQKHLKYTAKTLYRQNKNNVTEKSDINAVLWQKTCTQKKR
jgi:hypothetical protein